MDPQQQTPAQPSMTPPPMMPQGAPEKKSSSMGALIGAVIVILIIIFGGLYFWGAQLEKGQMAEELPFIPGDQDSMMPEQTGDQGLPPASSSDQAAAIESDVNATDLDALDAQIDQDLNNMEAALQ